jgi:hypothetical protein
MEPVFRKLRRPENQFREGRRDNQKMSHRDAPTGAKAKQERLEVTKKKAAQVLGIVSVAIFVVLIGTGVYALIGDGYTKYQAYQKTRISHQVRRLTLGCFERTANDNDCAEYLRQARLEATTATDHDVIEDLDNAVKADQFVADAISANNPKATKVYWSQEEDWYGKAAKLLGIPYPVTQR